MSDNETGFTLKNVNVDISVIEGSQSFKKTLLSPFLSKNARHLRGSKVVHALRDVSMEIGHGERVGLIGPNGAGKTTLLRLLSGSYFPTSGSMSMRGAVTAILNVGIGMDYDLSGYDNIVTCGMLLGLSRDEVRAAREEIVEFTALGDFIHMPIRTYSSGMLLRLSFAIATAFDPDILLIDEIIGVGDALFAEKARKRIERMVSDAKVLVIASHDEGIIKEFCSHAVFLENGRVEFFGEVEEGIQAYKDWRGQITG